MGASASGAFGSGVVSIVSLSSMLFMFPFENISVSIFSPDDRKKESGAMAEVAAAKTAASGVVLLLRVTGWSVAYSTAW